MDRFETFCNEDLTQEDYPAAQPWPDYIDPLVAGTLFKEYPQVNFSVALQPIDPFPQTEEFEVICKRSIDIIHSLRALQLETMYDSNQHAQFTDEADLLGSQEQLTGWDVGRGSAGRAHRLLLLHQHSTDWHWWTPGPITSNFVLRIPSL